MTVHVDVIEGSGLRETKDGLVATRMFVVSGLTGDGPAILYRALQTAGVPQRGDHHPSIPGIQADERAVAPAGKSIAKVTVVYRALDESDIEGGASAIETGAGLSQETTTTDANGNAISRDYDVYDEDDEGRRIGHRIVTHVASVNVQRPFVTYVVRATLSYSPLSLAKEFVGTVGVWGRDEWLCADIRGGSSDGGATYDVGFEFALPPHSGTWTVEVPEIDPKTGTDVPNGTPRAYDVYPRSDFSKLPIQAPS